MRPRLSTVLSWEPSISESVPSVTVARIAALTKTSTRPKPASDRRAVAVVAIVRGNRRSDADLESAMRPRPDTARGRTPVRPLESVTCRPGDYQLRLVGQPPFFSVAVQERTSPLAELCSIVN